MHKHVVLHLSILKVLYTLCKGHAADAPAQRIVSCSVKLSRLSPPVYTLSYIYIYIYTLDYALVFIILL